MTAAKFSTTILLLLTACATTGSETAVQEPLHSAPAGSREPVNPSEPGQVVLATGMRMVFTDHIALVGSCWDFVNAVYNAAGYPQNRRHTVFRSPPGSRQSGPFANLALLRPGDWVMHINYEFGGIEHSGIFVRWLDRTRNLALMLDYVGMHRRATGKLSQHNLARVFAILRAGDRT